MKLRTKKVMCYVVGTIFLVGFAWLGLRQLPELIYDAGGDVPTHVHNVAELDALEVGDARFVALHGKGDFRRAFRVSKYGVSMNFFNIHPYGMKVVVRSMARPTDHWHAFDTFVGKMKPFRKLPFRRQVLAWYNKDLEEHYRKKYAASRPATRSTSQPAAASAPASRPTVGRAGDPDLPPIPLDELSVGVPEGAYVLMLYDTPGKDAGWSIVALCVSAVICFLAVFMMYFFFPRLLKRRAEQPRPLDPLDLDVP